MDYVLTPTVPDLIVMQSTLSFATTVLDHIKKMENTPLLKGHLLFLEQVEKNVPMWRFSSHIRKS